MVLERKCLICKKTFKLKFKNSKQKFCSIKCKIINSKTGKTYEKRKCKNCGKTFLQRPCIKQKFCSAKCSAQSHKGTTFIEKKCSQCNKTFKNEPWKKQKFCSAKCSTQFHKGITFIEKKCPQCNKIFKSEPWKKQKFCSLSCSSKYARQVSPTIKKKCAGKKQDIDRKERQKMVKELLFIGF